MKIEKLLKLPDYVTLLNATCGLFSIFAVITGQVNLAIILLFLAVIFDFLDGKVARMTKTSSEFGKQLDSLSDVISFGIAPAVFVFIAYTSMFTIAACVVFLFAGILRLARYNISNKKNEYEGIPITWSGIVIPVIYLIRVPEIVYPIALLIYAVLMISSFKIKKVIK